MTRRAVRRWGRLAVGAILVVGACAGCGRPESDRVQGYVEGEYVYVAAPYAGALEALSVQRGAQVHVGEPLFALNSAPEKAARDEVERRVARRNAPEVARRVGYANVVFKKGKIQDLAVDHHRPGLGTVLVGGDSASAGLTLIGS